MEPLRASVTVEAPRDRAFELFTEGMGRWWPKEFSWSQDKLEDLGIEPHEDGFAYERGPRGFSIHWGRVTGRRRVRGGCARSVRFAAQDGPDAVEADEVGVRAV